MPERIGILGAGSWGTALAMVLAENGHTVRMWEFRDDIAERVQQTRENTDVLPGVHIPDAVTITSDLQSTVQNQDLLVLVVPSHFARDVCTQVAALDAKPVPIISVVKGIENVSLKRMSEVVHECIPALNEDQIGVLSGPSHAEEVSRNIPTAVVVAAQANGLAERVQSIFINQHFRVYVADDMAGVEFGGSLKNVIAIAAGICDGAELGDNTKAALITRGLAEMTRLGCTLGAQPQTFMGLAGIGDLVVTCMSRHSRNRHVGMEIGRGKSLQEVLDGMVMVAEGVKTTESAWQLAQRTQVDVPITAKVYQILFENVDPRQAVSDLMTRAPKSEAWDRITS
jgi:glycerol-3-phosphate dehydrogenase (NAD(P)+)